MCHCHHAVQLFEADKKGLASTFAFHCVNKHRNRQPAFSSSPQIPVSNSVVNVVNRRAAFAMRCLGGDRSELETFCGVMDLPKSASESRFRAINKTIHKDSTSLPKKKKTKKKSMQVAAKAEYDTAEVTDDHVRDITVSTDGTWTTRGHSSKQGVVTTIGMNNGKVLDTQAKSKVCKSCDYWNKQDPNSDKFRAW